MGTEVSRVASNLQRTVSIASSASPLESNCEVLEVSEGFVALKITRTFDER